MGSSKYDRIYPVLICLASFLLQTSLGMLYAMGVIYIMMKESLNAGDAQVALMPAMQFAAINIIGPLVGFLVQRFGERIIAMTGCILGASGLVGCCLSTNIYHMYISYSLINGVGLGMIYISSLTILDKYFDKHKSLAAGIAVSGVGVGQFLYPPMISALNNIYAWRGAMLLLAAMHLQLLVPAALLCSPKTVETKLLERGSTAKDEKFGDDTIGDLKDYIKDTDNDDRGDNTVNISCDIGNEVDRAPKSTEEIAKVLIIEQNSLLGKEWTEKTHRKKHCKSNWAPLFNQGFVSVLSYNLFLYFSNSLIYCHLGAYTLSLGFTKEDVVKIYTTIGISSTISRILAGLIAQLPFVNIIIFVGLSGCIIGLGTILLPLAKSLVWIYLYAVAFPSFMAPLIGLCLPVVAEVVHKHLVPAGMGFVCLLCTPGTLAGPPLAAWLYESTEMYNTSFYIAGGAFVLSGMSLFGAYKCKCCNK